jgi:transposase-like protein
VVEYQGYLTEFSPGRPGTNRWGYMFQHRLVAELILGRSLLRAEVVHHEDEDKHNNAPGNLWLFQGSSEHQRHHRRHSPRHDPAMVARLRPLAADPEVPFHEAARRLELSVSTVAKMVELHRIPWVSAGQHCLSDDQVRKALRGKSTAEAARALGVNHQTLRNRFPHLLSYRAKPCSLDEHRGEIRSLAMTMRDHEIAPRFGVCSETVGSSIRRWAREEDGWSDVLAARLARRLLGRPGRPRKASSPKMSRQERDARLQALPPSRRHRHPGPF